MSSPETERLKKSPHFNLQEHLEWAETKWGVPVNGVIHVRNVTRKLGDRISRFNFPQAAFNGAQFRGAMHKTCHWKHEIGSHEILQNLESTMRELADHYIASPSVPSPPPRIPDARSLDVAGAEQAHWGQF